MKNAVGVAKRNATQELVQKALQDRGLEATIAYIKVLLKVLVQILKSSALTGWNTQSTVCLRLRPLDEFSSMLQSHQLPKSEIDANAVVALAATLSVAL